MNDAWFTFTSLFLLLPFLDCKIDVRGMTGFEVDRSCLADSSACAFFTSIVNCMRIYTVVFADTTRS